jgi:hypothetical protein
VVISFYRLSLLLNLETARMMFECTPTLF